MASPRAVRRALRTLATGDRRGDGQEGATVTTARETIREAVEALGDVESAAAFFADGGVERLRDAVGVFSRAEEPTVRREGERALGIVERYRRAAGVEVDPETVSPPRSDVDTCTESSGDVVTRRVGTHLGGDGQRADR
ncbi:hypothetical protein [Haloprofundus salinisoli]|uniref:hypothetical protein n=1 Tax=Haloprofundus salinisoli TaxID=2876193 RepID=UPI001CCD7D14|nr:hypothetical protein [Haloprofundus salinisoli]